MHRHLATALGVALLGPASAAPKVRPKPDAESYFPTWLGTAWVLWEGDFEDIKFITKVEDRDGGKLVSVGRLRGGGSSRQSVSSSPGPVCSWWGPAD